jgi:serine/threonine protein phosphatase PrpC
MSGSTLVMAIVSQAHIFLANCGDSRGIIINEYGNVVMQTRDHKPDR